MARAGVTYEQVEKAANDLVSLKQVGLDGNPTNKAVRERLGTGSANTIHAHLQTWKSRRPAPAPVSAELPAAIARVVVDELARARAAAQVELQAQLEATLTDAADLARVGEQLESELTGVQEQLAAITAERDRTAGQLEEQQREAQRLAEALERERTAAENARVQLAEARLKTEAADAAATALRAEREAQIRAGEQERQARIEAERRLAAADASCAELVKHVDQLVASNAALVQDRERLRGMLDQEKDQHGATRSSLAAEQQKAAAAEKRAEDLREREERLRKELSEARGKDPSPKEPSHASDKPQKGGARE